MVAGTPIDLAAIKTPMLVIALKDDHVSAWEAVYSGARHLEADFVLGGSGHNAGRDQPAEPQQARLLDRAEDACPRTPPTGSPRRPRTRAAGGRGGPNGWRDKGSGKTVPARKADKPIEPAPGTYAMMP